MVELIYFCFMGLSAIALGTLIMFAVGTLGVPLGIEILGRPLGTGSPLLFLLGLLIGLPIIVYGIKDFIKERHIRAVREESLFFIGLRMALRAEGCFNESAPSAWDFCKQEGITPPAPVRRKWKKRGHWT